MDELREFVLTVNGSERKVRAHSGTSLLKVLRENLNLTGTKEGCSEGHCGTCAVLVDGKVEKSCHFPAEKAVGKSVTTIEGVGTKNKLHPVQQAFIETGAIQCGFCTPGMIITAKGLLDANPKPGREDIIRAFQGNLCRCTGYVKIIEAVEQAAAIMAGSGQAITNEDEGKVLGASLPRVDAVAKTIGEAVFADDIKMQGMLYAAVVRSPYHHALIKTIDKGPALALRGVEAVFTAEDVPGFNRVKIFRPDWPVLADGKVRFAGDAVALVVADSLERAREACGKVVVEYEELPVFFDPHHAAAEENIRIHEDSPNIAFSKSLTKGNAAEGFAQAEIIIENIYTTPAYEHAYLESEAGVAYVDSEGVLVVLVGTQNAQHLRTELAGVVNLPVDKVRVIQTVTGGGFGGKLDITIQGLLAVAAHLTKRPVKIVFSREESFQGTTKRHPFYMKHRLGATKEGVLKALEVEFLADTGAYLSFGPGVVIRAVVHATGPYRIPHVKVTGQAVYTNNPPSGAMRGFGVPQIAFALETQMDLLAEKLGLDPLELRWRNGYVGKDVTATGQQLEEKLGYLETLSALRTDYQEAIAKVQSQQEEGKIRKGVGIASMWFGPGKTGLAEKSEVMLQLSPEGKVRMVTAAADIGQGLDTVMAQLAAEALEIPYAMVEVSTRDTFGSPDGGFTCASRQTYNTGNAVLRAADKFRANLLLGAAKVLGVPSTELVFKNGLVKAQKNPEVSLGLAQLYSRNIPNAYGQYAAEVTPLDDEGQGLAYETYTFGTQMAEIELNTETGKVKVLRVVAAHDTGTPVNPQNVEGQLEGGVLMGLGMALKEEYITGKTKNFGNYRIPRIKDAPETKVIHLDVKHEHGPFGAAGAGECSLVPTAPAIVNAVSRAIGHRFFDLPITAAKVKAALAKQGNNGL
ncbi:MAG: molybdopterin-dependent oxidoreductase [Desulfitobacteriaceae bacterium]